MPISDNVQVKWRHFSTCFVLNHAYHDSPFTWVSILTGTYMQLQTQSYSHCMMYHRSVARVKGGVTFFRLGGGTWAHLSSSGIQGQSPRLGLRGLSVWKLLKDRGFFCIEIRFEIFGNSLSYEIGHMMMFYIPLTWTSLYKKYSVLCLSQLVGQRH